MRVVAWGVVVDAMDVPESGADLSSWTLVTGHVFGSVSEHAGSMYEPSIASDFSGFLPVFTTDGCKPVAVDYDADRVVQSAWNWNLTGNQIFGQGFLTPIPQRWI